MGRNSIKFCQTTKATKISNTPANHGKIGGLRILNLARAVRHEANEKKRRRADHREAVRSLIDDGITEQEGGRCEDAT